MDDIYVLVLVTARTNCIYFSFLFDRSVVSAVQREVDPQGVEERRRRTFIRRAYINKGPNYLIHIDGYDKLKRYGFPIHGAIDG